MKSTFKMIALYIISILIYNIPEAKSQIADKEFEVFFKNFEKARLKKNTNWILENSFDKVVFEYEEDPNGDVNFEMLNNPKADFYSKNSFVGEKTFYELSMDDKLFPLNNCGYSHKKPQEKLKEVYSFLDEGSKLYAVEFQNEYKSDKNKSGKETGRKYQAGMVFAKIEGRFILVGYWDCNLGLKKKK